MEPMQQTRPVTTHGAKGPAPDVRGFEKRVDYWTGYWIYSAYKCGQRVDGPFPMPLLSMPAITLSKSQKTKKRNRDIRIAIAITNRAIPYMNRAVRAHTPLASPVPLTLRQGELARHMTETIKSLLAFYTPTSEECGPRLSREAERLRRAWATRNRFRQAQMPGCRF